MAESAVDTIINRLGKSLGDHPCTTHNCKVLGSQTSAHADNEIPKHLTGLYGDQSEKVMRIAKEENAHSKLSPNLDTITAEVLYCIRYEYAKKPLDFIVRRINVGLSDNTRAKEMLSNVIQVMRKELDWSDEVAERMTEESENMLMEEG